MPDNRRQSTARERRLSELVHADLGDLTGEPFRPFVIYDQEMDRIVVMIRDCSFSEWRWGILVLYEDMYAKTAESKYVGFAIERARTFCRSRRLPHSGRIGTALILEAIKRELPALWTQIFIAQDLLKHLESSEVELS